ncbi:unnamed protein product [Durusdinium trenchii]|uniref:Uncharacterized protein n=1 Tax=Durusdinium trenchii TaxID=1381693 RepID=A0ABP0HG72_9DINO
MMHCLVSTGCFLGGNCFLPGPWTAATFHLYVKFQDWELKDGTRWRLRRATGRLEEQRELVAQKRAQEQEHQRLKRLELHEHLATTAKRQRVDALGEIESSFWARRAHGP